MSPDYGGLDDGSARCDDTAKKIRPLVVTINSNAHLRSAFFRLCFFFDGFEITLILLEWKTPMSVPFP